MNVADSTRDPFGPEELKAKSRELFTGNELDSDEYRESQPGRTFSYLTELTEHHPLDGPQQLELMKLAKQWLDAVVQEWGTPGWSHIGYAGSEAGHQLYDMIHDLLWDDGEHPIFETLEELKEFIADDED